MTFRDLNTGSGSSGTTEYDLYIDASCMCKLTVPFHVDTYEALITSVPAAILHFKIYPLWCANKPLRYTL